MALIVFDKACRRYAVVVTLDPDEAENIANALGSKDAAYQELYDAAAEARAADAVLDEFDGGLS